MGDKQGHPFRGNQFTVGTSRSDGDYGSAETLHGSHATLEGAQKEARELAARMGEGYEAVVYGDKIPGSQMLEIHDRVKGGAAPDLDHLARENKIPAKVADVPAGGRGEFVGRPPVANPYARPAEQTAEIMAAREKNRAAAAARRSGLIAAGVPAAQGPVTRGDEKRMAALVAEVQKSGNLDQRTQDAIKLVERGAHKIGPDSYNEIAAHLAKVRQGRGKPRRSAR